MSPGIKGGGGAWFDEFFLNKRVGYFLLKLVDLFGSVNLAQEGNLFHIRPEATRPGDTLVHRHGKYAPIGHSLFVYQSRTLEPGRMEIEIVSGSMPARQPTWEPHYQARNYFLSQEGGGERSEQECRPDYRLDWENKTRCSKELATIDRGEGDTCPAGFEPHVFDATKCAKYSYIPSETTDLRKMGGGIRRFRTPAKQNGRWMNIVPLNARDVYIPDTDLESIGKRPAQFEQLLSLGSPEERKKAALATIESAREYIRSAPSTCSKRKSREDAFQELYSAYEEQQQYDRVKIDRDHRTLEDYVFAELDYDSSKTCCWNSTKHEHFDTIMKWVNAEMEKAAHNATCTPPPVFKATPGGDGYDTVRSFARANGLPFPDAWSEDEPCKAKDVSEDTLSSRSGVGDYCGVNAPPPPAGSSPSPFFDGDT